MSSYYSPDLFLEYIDIVVIFLEDGLIAHLPGYDSKGRIHESGDLVKVDRVDIEAGKTTQPAVILGWGDCKNSAVSESRSYFTRLAKWHGHSDDISRFQLFGHDTSDSQLLWPVEEIPRNDQEPESRQRTADQEPESRRRIAEQEPQSKRHRIAEQEPQSKRHRRI